MKRFFSILLCLALFSTLVACGGGTDDDAAESQGIEQSEQSGDTEAKTSGLKIAYSVGYVGNAWRSQHVASLEEAAEAYKADGTIAEFQVVSADNDSTTPVSYTHLLTLLYHFLEKLAN